MSEITLDGTDKMISYFIEKLKKAGIDVMRVQINPNIGNCQTIEGFKQEIDEFVSIVAEALSYASELVVQGLSPYSLIPWNSIHQGKSIGEIKDEIKYSVTNYILYLQLGEISESEYLDFAHNKANSAVAWQILAGHNQHVHNLYAALEAEKEMKSRKDEAERAHEKALKDYEAADAKCNALIDHGNELYRQSEEAKAKAVEGILAGEDANYLLESYYQARKEENKLHDRLDSAENRRRYLSSRESKLEKDLLKALTDYQRAMVKREALTRVAIVFSDAIVEEAKAQVSKLKSLKVENN